MLRTFLSFLAAKPTHAVISDRRMAMVTLSRNEKRIRNSIVAFSDRT